MLTDEKIKELEAKGFKRWSKAGKDRLYINASVLGLVCEYYKTGNIKDAYFKGESISNSEARRMKEAKTFVDIVTGKVYGDNQTLKDAAEALMGEVEEEEEEEYHPRRRYTSSTNGDYGPSNPWDAPGMCVSDFITGVRW